MEEHRQILEMVAEGKITVEEGTKLLDALREAPPHEPEHVEIHHVPGGEILTTISHAAAGDKSRHRVRRTWRVRTRPGRSVDRIVSFASHGISPDYVRDMHEVFDDVSSEDLISLSSMDVTPEYVERVKEAFGDDIGVGEIISLSSMHVSPEYIDAIREALGEDVSPAEIISLSSMHVSPEYIDAIREALGEDVSPAEIISLSSMHVSPEYIVALAEAGLDTPTVKDVLKKKIEDE